MLLDGETRRGPHRLVDNETRRVLGAELGEHGNTQGHGQKALALVA
jgi:hypothetical protein